LTEEHETFEEKSKQATLVLRSRTSFSEIEYSFAGRRMQAVRPASSMHHKASAHGRNKGQYGKSQFFVQFLVLTIANNQEIR
jgi:hypothetical protein